MSKNQLALMTPEIREAFPAEVLDVIRTSFAPNATDAEFVLFAHKAASYKLDPFKNEIFFIKYGNTARIQFAAAAYLSKAREKEGFQPPDTQIVCDNDTFKAKRVRVLDEGIGAQVDTWEIVEHEVSFPRGKIVGAYSVAPRTGYRPVTVFVEKEHIAHVYTGQNKDNWNKWEPDMIGKFAEQRALSKQYGLDLNEDEAPPASPLEAANAPRDITAEADAASGQETAKQSPPPKQQEPEQAAPKPLEGDPDDELKGKIAEVKALSLKLGMSTKPARDKYIERKLQGEQLTCKNIDSLIKIMQMEIEEAELKPENLPPLE